MVKYEDAKVYKIIGPNPSEPCYVGSTTKKYISQRFTKHKHSYISWKNGEVNHHLASFKMFDKYGVENCRIILLESVDVVSKEELRIKEQEWMDKLDCVNNNRAYNTPEDTKIRQKEHHKNYRIMYRDELKAYHKVRAKIKYTCESCNKVVAHIKRARHNKTNLHIINTIKYMESITSLYNKIQPTKIQYFVLE